MQERVAALRAYYETGATQSYAFRLSMLKKLRAALKKHEKDAYAAYKKDYNKGMLETTAYEFAVVYAELDEAILNLKQWMGVKKNKVPLFSIPGRGERYRDPYGVVLIVSPWNFPHNLTFCPLIGAIAGGNCAVLKPSNYTPTISKVIKETVEEAFPENYITVVTGGRE
ncbi:MAG TPA: aldehyde dehydrogenase family protein, partial [Clostridiales bacterium]|nr:aldehyde dehydrogenase family protein [Clostridiales bacterium]